MRYTLEKKKYGIGLAAPQVGESIALIIIGIKPTPSRPKLESYEAVIINPIIIKDYGKKEAMWEGCISLGSSNSPIFVQAMRYPKIRLEYQDDQAETHIETFDGIKAHLLQHEIDHLRGILFVDRVKDSTTFMNLSEYKKRIVKPRIKHETESAKES